MESAQETSLEQFENIVSYVQYIYTHYDVSCIARPQLIFDSL